MTIPHTVDAKDMKVGNLYQYKGGVSEILTCLGDFWVQNPVPSVGMLYSGDVFTVLAKDTKTVRWGTPIFKVAVSKSGMVGWIRPLTGSIIEL